MRSRRAAPVTSAPRHAPERTRLYALVREHYDRFLDHLATEDRALPDHVREEFALLLPGTDANGAEGLVQAIMQALQNTEFKLPDGRKTRLALSAGIACRDPLRHPDRRSLVADADQALYAAKAGGRARCVVACADPCPFE